MFNIDEIRKDFPMIKNNPNMTYLDSSATSFKPQCVIDEVVNYYSKYNTNIHRGDYDISYKVDGLSQAEKDAEARINFREQMDKRRTEREKLMRIVVKVGTSTLAHSTGMMNIRRVEELVKVLSDLKNAGHEIVLVSSGAIGMGVGKLNLGARPSDTEGKQAAAAVGQCELMYTYDKLFSEYHHTVWMLLLNLAELLQNLVPSGNLCAIREVRMKEHALCLILGAVIVSLGYQLTVSCIVRPRYFELVVCLTVHYFLYHLAILLTEVA